MVARVRRGNREVDLICLLCVKRKDDNDIRINREAGVDVDGVVHTVPINGEDRFKEGTHWQVKFSKFPTRELK